MLTGEGLVPSGRSGRPAVTGGTQLWLAPDRPLAGFGAPAFVSGRLRHR